MGQERSRNVGLELRVTGDSSEMILQRWNASVLFLERGGGGTWRSVGSVCGCVRMVRICGYERFGGVEK